MELEVSYNENYCVEGQVERRRGAPESVEGGGEVGEVVGMDCVDRHTFFVTLLMLLSKEADRSRAHHEPSVSHSHGQPRQLRRRGWAERRPMQALPTAPCDRRARALPRKAAGAVRREADVRLEERRIRVGGAQERHSRLLPSRWPRHAPCRTCACPPR